MLMLDLQLTDELTLLEERLQASWPQLQKAIDRALKKTAKWLETHSKRELGQALALPQRVLSVRYQHSFYLKEGSRNVSVWFGLDPINASFIGKMRQTAKGAKVGKHLFQGAFIAEMDSGHQGVFARKTTSSNWRRHKRKDGQWTELPIEEQFVPIEQIASEVLERYYQRAQGRFKQLLQQEVNYVLNHESRG